MRTRQNGTGRVADPMAYRAAFALGMLPHADAEVPPDFFAESDDEDDTHPDERISGACGPPP